jgi:hemin uptake protein HemP
MKPPHLHNDASSSLNKAQSKLPTHVAAATPLTSSTLFAGRSEVIIAHGDETYRLRLTRQNRLILTK